MAKYNEKHQEIPDPTPVALPIGFHRPPSLGDMMRRFQMDMRGLVESSMHKETDQEAEDFDVVDDMDGMLSEHQLKVMEEEVIIDAKRKAPTDPKVSSTDEVPPTPTPKPGQGVDNNPPEPPRKPKKTTTTVVEELG